jgi:hypothetical protein
MAAENAEARALINDASTTLSDTERERQLNSALAELGQPGGLDDDPEARGIALALLGQLDASYLPDAEQSPSEARPKNAPTNWISLHLADAYYIAGDYSNAAKHAREVDQSYFDRHDLHWRSVKVTEILAASLLGLGDFEEGLKFAKYVCGQIATRGDIDQDDLASPSELAQRALNMINNPASSRAREVGCEIAKDISMTINLREWFPSSLANELIGAIRSCSDFL